MSTVDQQTSLQVIKGRYKDDGFDSIIIYGTMFGNIAFKLCRGATNLRSIKETFDVNRWPYALGWSETVNGYGPQAAKEFLEELEKFCKKHEATHKLSPF